MKMHSRVLTDGIRKTILIAEDVHTATKDELVTGLERAWNAWCFSMRYRNQTDGAPSFGLIALGLMFACIDQLECLPEL
jgi:hypothetical protein